MEAQHILYVFDFHCTKQKNKQMHLDNQSTYISMYSSSTVADILKYSHTDQTFFRNVL